MRISDWSSDVCSSDLGRLEERKIEPHRQRQCRACRGIGQNAVGNAAEARRVCEAVHGSFPRVPVYLVPSLESFHQWAEGRYAGGACEVSPAPPPSLTLPGGDQPASVCAAGRTALKPLSLRCSGRSEGRTGGKECVSPSNSRV